MSIAVAPRQPISATSLPPVVAPTVRRCYDVLDLCRGCGIIDFTDGKYIDSCNDRTGYLAAQRRQAAYLLDQVGCASGSRILDIGCGYGRIVQAATACSAAATGLTISPPQMANCRKRGLDVRLCNYRELFTRGEYDDWEHAFDGIIANGSLEHFVQCEDAAAGRADAMYTEFFDVCHRLLSPGGKLATTAIHMRRAGQWNAADLLGEPGRWPKGSEHYHLADVLRNFGGWYPEPGQLERCAEGRFRLIAAEDGTHDYLLTSEYWMRQIRRSLALNPRAWLSALRVFVRQPHAALEMMRCLLRDESWNYQFRAPAPTQLWRQTWVAV